jgi:hypothetical protein
MSAQGSCVGGVFEDGNAAAIDVVLALADGTELWVSLSSATQNQSATLSAPPASVDDQALFLGASVPDGAVWLRRRSSGGSLQSLVGAVDIGAISIVPAGCTDACKAGSLAMNLTLTGVHGSSPGGDVYSGTVQVSASGGDKSCTSPADCDPGTTCNAVLPVTYQSYCTKANASGTGLGEACTSRSDCSSAYCEPAEGECSLVCGSEADCSGSTACMAVLADTAHTECLRTCGSNADCAALPSAGVCMLHTTPSGTALVGGCEAAQGPTHFGQTPTNQSPCGSNLFLTVGQNQVCTHLCKTDADCAPPLPSCLEGTVGQTFTANFCQ